MYSAVFHGSICVCWICQFYIRTSLNAKHGINPRLLRILQKIIARVSVVLMLIMKMLWSIQEMQQSMNMLQPQQNLPDAAEMLTKWFGGGGGGSDTAKKSTTKSRSVRNR